ncbi:MAG: ABC transporter ATP-binding protein [Deltaproteobacteria bacterium]|nr:ABC transporter ATP-binding protein [Deltaproteobacteria bacterium]
MAEALLALREILVRYGGSTVLQVAALSVRPGEVLAIIGPNGAGKSTLLRVMGLLEQPTEGRVYFRGREIEPKDSLAVRRRMASVFQEPLLLNASVYENAALGLKLRGLSQREAERRVRPWLERLGIVHLAGRRARSLSGGEAQRTRDHPARDRHHHGLCHSRQKRSLYVGRPGRRSDWRRAPAGGGGERRFRPAGQPGGGSLRAPPSSEATAAHVIKQK